MAASLGFARAVQGMNETMGHAVVCYGGRISVNNGLWQTDNPFTQSLPNFTKGLAVLLVVSRLVIVLLRPFNLPRLAPELLGVVLVGPMVLGKWQYFSQSIFPYTNVFTWETLANMGLMYHAFIAGLGSDIKAVSQPGSKALRLAIAGVLVPFIAGYGLFYLAGGSLLPLKYDGDIFTSIPQSELSRLLPRGAFLSGVALAATSFSSVTEALANHKLLHTDIGRLAMTSAMITEICTWGMLGLAVLLTFSLRTMELAPVAAAALWAAAQWGLGPGTSWLLGHTNEGEEMGEVQVCLALTAMMASGFAANVLGVHPVVGAFLLGQGIPNRLLRLELLEKLDDMVSGIFLPLYLGSALMKISPASFIDESQIKHKIFRSIAVVVVTGAAKLGSVFWVALSHKLSVRDSLTLGMVSSSKSALSIILLHIGMDNQPKFRREAGFIFGSMMMAAILVTGVMNLVLKELVKPTRRVLQNASRSIESQKPNSELRILTPIYSFQDVPGLISILELSQATSVSPLEVIALRLNELTSRSSANFFIQDLRKPNADGGKRFSAKKQSTYEGRDVQIDDDLQIFEAFEKYEDSNSSSDISLHLLTATSPYATMHEDICSLSHDQRVALIILPFHQQQKIDEGMDEDNTFVRGVNQNVLAEAPCSVGIFVDRGLTMPLAAGAPTACCRIAMLFFGGPDDREALYYAWRMRDHPGASLSVTRFVCSDESIDLEHPGMPCKTNPLLPHAQTEYEKQKRIDDVVIDELWVRMEGDESVSYSEVVSNNGEDTVMAIRDLEEHNYDLFVVGKGDRLLSPLTMGLNDWSDWPELGAVGDILVTSDFLRNSSVMVMQQHVGAVAALQATMDDLNFLDGSSRNSGSINRQGQSMQHKNWLPDV